MTCAFVAGDACCVTQNPGLYCSNDALGNPCNCQGIACHDFQITCDGPEDCPGKICCADTGFLGGGYDVVECRDSCVSDTVGATRKEVCHPGGQPCANGTACQADPMLPPSYYTCEK